jgi:hypothetical protein
MAKSFYTAYKAVFTALKSVIDYVPAVPAVPVVPAHDEEPEIPEVPGVAASGVAKTVFVGENFALTPDTPLFVFLLLFLDRIYLAVYELVCGAEGHIHFFESLELLVPFNRTVSRHIMRRFVCFFL